MTELLLFGIFLAVVALNVITCSYLEAMNRNQIRIGKGLEKILKKMKGEEE